MNTNRLVAVALALIIGSGAFGKGRPRKVVHLDAPKVYEMLGTEFEIAAGDIEEFSDERGGLAEGPLHQASRVFGIPFPAGTKVNVSDYIPEGDLGATEVFLTAAESEVFQVETLTLSYWMSFRREGQVILAQGNIDRGGKILGVQIAPQPYFEYQCSYTDCTHINRLMNFTLAQNLNYLGIDMVAGTHIDFRLGSTEINSPVNVRVNGYLVQGGGDEHGYRHTFYLNQFNRLISFNAGEAMTIEGHPVAEGYYVRLDADGHPLVIGNTPISQK